MSANVTQSTLACVWFNCSCCSSALRRCGSRTILLSCARRCWCTPLAMRADQLGKESS
ncbi:Hypothetical protein PMT_2547 [Prochlorococcus marinus str. MIT 9313]|uniref:Uncharacterized protein n=1 Tax=Prochlorococcus marinus (strain MIT 9313) TaxID=74547 RepID=B9ERL1_PROMM|nr:Hypothetical protein PMT_2547 [Prochlorococcus marinus str. MIT 9313]